MKLNTVQNSNFLLFSNIFILMQTFDIYKSKFKILKVYTIRFQRFKNQKVKVWCKYAEQGIFCIVHIHILPILISIVETFNFSIYKKTTPIHIFILVSAPLIKASSFNPAWVHLQCGYRIKINLICRLTIIHNTLVFSSSIIIFQVLGSSICQRWSSWKVQQQLHSSLQLNRPTSILSSLRSFHLQIV